MHCNANERFVKHYQICREQQKYSSVKDVPMLFPQVLYAWLGDEVHDSSEEGKPVLLRSQCKPQCLLFAPASTPTSSLLRPSAFIALYFLYDYSFISLKVRSILSVEEFSR